MITRYRAKSACKGCLGGRSSYVTVHYGDKALLDPKLIERALELSGERTKKSAVTKALQEFIARRRQKRLLDVMGEL
jgi:hypothetical protein